MRLRSTEQCCWAAGQLATGTWPEKNAEDLLVDWPLAGRAQAERIFAEAFG